jgi:DNA polymerase III subunit gamma/tau
MFENIIGQRGTIETLQTELARGSFPRSALFFGPLYSGKLSAALEAARVLTCGEGTGEWSCECASCRSQKELAHPHTVLLGSRYWDVEIAACADSLLRNRRPPSQYLFLRSVRKLTRRFDTVVWDAEESRVKMAQEKVASIEEMLLSVAPGRELPPEKKLSDVLEEIISACLQLAGMGRGETISIGQIRRLSSWAHVTAGESGKVAILENVDRMQDSARNALLKLLEEPPAYVHIIALSTRRAAVIPTILSRLRPYAFEQRGHAEESDVLVRIFREEPGHFEGLRSFFLAWKEINPEKLGQISRRFIEAVTSPEEPEGDALSELADLFPSERRSSRERNQKDAVLSFLEELMLRLRDPLRSGAIALEVLEDWADAVRESLMRIETFNMNPATVMEALFLRMRERARRDAAEKAAETLS